MKYVVTLLVVAIASLAAMGLYVYRPETKKERPVRPVPIVQTVEIEPRTEAVYIEAFGSVVPARKIDLYPEVEGRIIEQSAELVPGGILKKDDFIVRIDPVDYEMQLKDRAADVAEAQYGLELEKGQQKIARREWELFERDGEPLEASKSLALREPHLRNAEAKLEAAISRLEEAKLRLDRTVIRSPFNALVLEKSVDKGQLIGPQKPIATLVETDYFWVQVSVPVAMVGRMRFPDGGGQGSPARVVLDLGDGRSIVKEGSIYKLLGDLEPKGRMARVLVSINDPLNMGESSAKGSGGSAVKGGILLGSYVRVLIDAGALDDVYVVPRQALREGDMLWLLSEDGRLDIVRSDVRWRRREEVLVEANVPPGARLITSRLQAPLPGMALRVDSGVSNAPGAKEE